MNTIEGWDKVKFQFSQKILDALERRGFYDAGKYLDETIIERVEPLIRTLLRESAALERRRLAKEIETTLNELLCKYSLDRPAPVSVVRKTFEDLVDSLLRTSN